MRYIGRIITTTKIEGISEFIDVTKDSSFITNNEAKIPTLIIGYKNAENICGGLRMTEKKIGTNLWWTFSKRERRIDYEPDLQNFLSNVSAFLTKSCQYEYLDPITWDKEKEMTFSADILIDSRLKIIYTTSTMYYIFSPHLKKTYGLSKEVLSFKCGKGYDFLDEIFECGSGKVVSDSEFSETKITKFKFIMPLLYYLKNF